MVKHSRISRLLAVPELMLSALRVAPALQPKTVDFDELEKSVLQALKKKPKLPARQWQSLVETM
jgi:hypothetical protein